VPFRYTFRVEDKATTVPYAAVKDDIRENRGFVDLRGRPDLAKKIAEAGVSIALRDLLINVASSKSPIFTLGCDLGSHMEPTNVPLRRRMEAGGGMCKLLASIIIEHQLTLTRRSQIQLLRPCGI
jgi:hypothetical protein